MLAMERCSASGWNQTGTTHQTRNGAPRIKRPRPKSPEQRQPTRWKGARPNSPASKKKRPALPTHQVTIRIGTTQCQAPLRTTHGTTPPVAGIQSQEPDDKPIRPLQEIRLGLTARVSEAAQPIRKRAS